MKVSLLSHRNSWNEIETFQEWSIWFASWEDHVIPVVKNPYSHVVMKEFALPTKYLLTMELENHEYLEWDLQHELPLPIYEVCIAWDGSHLWLDGCRVDLGVVARMLYVPLAQGWYSNHSEESSYPHVFGL